VSEIIAAQKTTTVEVTATVDSEMRETISFDIQIAHTPEVGEEMILMAALNKVKANGGGIVHDATGMKFYPASKLLAPLTFKTKVIISLSA
jgi:hypothetical protein